MKMSRGDDTRSKALWEKKNKKNKTTHPSESYQREQIKRGWKRGEKWMDAWWMMGGETEQEEEEEGPPPGGGRGRGGRPESSEGGTLTLMEKKTRKTRAGRPGGKKERAAFDWLPPPAPPPESRAGAFNWSAPHAEQPGRAQRGFGREGSGPPVRDRRAMERRRAEGNAGKGWKRTGGGGEDEGGRGDPEYRQMRGGNRKEG